MKHIYCLSFLCIIYIASVAQPLPDSVKKIFNAAKTDVERAKELMIYFDATNEKDSIFGNLVQIRQYFEDKKDAVAADYVGLGLSRQMSRASDYAEALKYLFQLMPRFEKRQDVYGIMCCNRAFSYAYYAAFDKDKTLYYDKKTLDLSLVLNVKYDLAVAYNNLAADLSEFEVFDSTFFYAEKAVKIAKETGNAILICKTLGTLGECYIAQKNYEKAIPFIRESMPIARKNSPVDLAYCYIDFAQIYQAQHSYDSAIYYAMKGAAIANEINLRAQVLRAYKYLSGVYKETGPTDSAYKYLELTTDAKDLIFSAGKTKQVELINLREQNRIHEIEQQRLEYNTRIKIYALLGGLALFSVIGFFLYRNSYRDKKAKLVLQNKNELIEKTLSDLRATQTQLIQSEKMASLGELTAGIAHEIQNPLNFVNNFSDLNKELLEELEEEVAKGNYAEAIVIAKDLKDNEEKINHHGKRADAIVKGMLQHSRSSSGVKEPTDINTLCDEYLRLSYHGLRAKNKDFNATMKTDFDPSIGKINIIPQDIGRVVLNLLNNAFYAVEEKKKSGVDGYEPTVTIATRYIQHPSGGQTVEIKVCDNGGGIPQKFLDKIFHPFFTTKPTGQGTGLGLSLSYDIVTKGHNGELKAETKEGEFTQFVITLPV